MWIRIRQNDDDLSGSESTPRGLRTVSVLNTRMRQVLSFLLLIGDSYVQRSNPWIATRLIWLFCLELVFKVESGSGLLCSIRPRVSSD
jgi:hypothetical protein